MKKQNQKRRILLVDDYSDTALSFKMGSQDDGFDVDAFDDPISALSAFKPDSYDLLVLDIEMDKINGFELYERIKKIDDKVKVCFVTAMEEYKHKYKQKSMHPSSSSASYSSGDATFLIKPITIDELVRKVNELITI